MDEPPNNAPPTANANAAIAIGHTSARRVANATEIPAPSSSPMLINVVSRPTPLSPRPSRSIARGTVSTPIAPVATADADAIITSRRGLRDRANVASPLTASVARLQGRNGPLGCASARGVCTPRVSTTPTSNAPAATA